jgi:hypothetical protein
VGTGDVDHRALVEGARLERTRGANLGEHGSVEPQVVVLCLLEVEDELVDAWAGEEERVGASAAGELVLAGTAFEDVGPRAALDDVVAIPADDVVALRAAEQGVGVAAACDLERLAAISGPLVPSMNNAS